MPSRVTYFPRRKGGRVGARRKRKNGKQVPREYKFILRNQLLLTNVTGGQGYAFTPMLSDIATSASLVGLFGLYKITKVKRKFMPTFDSANQIVAIAGASYSQPMHFVNDLSGSNSIGTVSLLLQFANVKTIMTTQPGSITLNPIVLNGLGAGGTSSTMSSKKVWIPTGNANVQNLCMRFYVPDTGQANGQPLGYFLDTYYISCKIQN